MYDKKMMGGGMAKMADGGKGKKGVMIGILAKLKGPKEQEEEGMSEDVGEEEESEMDMDASKEAKLAAAEEVMSALKSGDKEAFAGALENFMSACGYAEGGMVSEDEMEMKREGMMAQGGKLKKGDPDTYITKEGKETKRGLWSNVYMKKKREGKL